MLARSMRGFATLTCLAIFLYDAPHATACREDEHELLLNAIARRRADRAAELMLEHLHHIEASLDLAAPRDEAVDLAAVLAVR
jgi:DNA-binding GntR family transcriptional regulator